MRSLCHREWMSECISVSVYRLVSQSVSQSVYQSITRSACVSVSQDVNRSAVSPIIQAATLDTAQRIPRQSNDPFDKQSHWRRDILRKNARVIFNWRHQIDMWLQWHVKCRILFGEWRLTALSSTRHESDLNASIEVVSFASSPSPFHSALMSAIEVGNAARKGRKVLLVRWVKSSLCSGRRCSSNSLKSRSSPFKFRSRHTGHRME